ncbi:MAG: response regulator transcription factor [Deltaproteobacteria bacterium]|nr:response regulator transcription factor [Deltaproteobacteria bacterium]
MRVLLIEDERSLVDAIRSGLQTESIAVDCSYDGEEGLFKAQEGSYDALVLDISLPGRNGYEVCKKLREAEIWTPILMLTARHGEEHEAKALNLGADDFLSKPFSYVVLVARLRALVRRGAAPRPTVIHSGYLELDPLRMTCRCEGHEIHLTAREFALLELFMRRPGEVLPKQQILDHVWGFDFEGDENIVEVYVGYLRRKIDEPFGQRSLQTVRGVGYRLVRSED